MKLTDIDFYATFGETRLHKLKPKYKLCSAFFLLAAILINTNLYIAGILYFSFIIILIAFKLPILKIFKASLYPIIFLTIFLFSYDNLTLKTLLFLTLRVLSASTVFVTLIFTTTYMDILRALTGIFPEVLLNLMFYTYRSLFILSNTLDNLLTSLRLRSNLSIKKPLFSLQVIGSLIGFFIIKSIETSEKMSDGIKLRGYSGNFNYLRK